MGPLSCGAVGVGPSEDLPRDGWILAAEWLAHAGVLSCLDGETLLGALSERLTEAGIEGMAARSLRLYRQFYLTCPQIWQTVSAKTILEPDRIIIFLLDTIVL